MRDYILSILCATACTLLLAGCEAERIAPDSTGQAITFSTPEGWTPLQPATKADFTGDNFGVFAYYTAPDNKTYDFMDNQLVTRNNENVWVYEPVKYWPTNGTLDFYAYAPYLASGVSMEGKTFTYTNTGDVDLLVAPVQSHDSPASVQFNFQHVLGKLKFAFKRTAESIDYKVSKISFEPTHGTEAPTVTGWTFNLSQNGTFTKTTSTIITSTTDATPIEELTCYLTVGTEISKVTITIDEEDKECTLTEPITIAANTETTVTFSVSVTDGKFIVDAFPEWKEVTEEIEGELQ